MILFGKTKFGKKYSIKILKIYNGLLFLVVFFVPSSLSPACTDVPADSNPTVKYIFRG